MSQQQHQERLNHLILACYDTKNTAMKNTRRLVHSSCGMREDSPPLMRSETPQLGLSFPTCTRQSMEQVKRKQKKNKVERESSATMIEMTKIPVSVNSVPLHHSKINNPLKDSIGFNAVKPQVGSDESGLKQLGITNSLVKKIWDNTLKYIENELISGKPVEIPNLGLLTFNTETQDCGTYSRKHQTPVFILSEHFQKRYSISTLKVPLNDGKRKMNVAQIATNVNASKNVVKAVIESIVKNIGQKASEATKKEYSVNLKVCKLLFKGKHCHPKWDATFLQNIEKNLTKTLLSTEVTAPPRGQYESARRTKKLIEELGLSIRAPTPALDHSSPCNSANLSTKSNFSTISLGPPYDVDKITSVSSEDFKHVSPTHSAKELQTRKKFGKDSLSNKVGQSLDQVYVPDPNRSLLKQRPSTPFEVDKDKEEDVRIGLKNLLIDKHNKKEVTHFNHEKEKFYNEWVSQKEKELDDSFKQDSVNNTNAVHNYNLNAAREKKKAEKEAQEKTSHLDNMHSLHTSLVETFKNERNKKDTYARELANHHQKQEKLDEAPLPDFDNSIFMKNSYDHKTDPAYWKQRRENQKKFYDSLQNQVLEKKELDKQYELESLRNSNQVIVKGSDDDYKKRQEQYKSKARDEFKEFITSKENEIKRLREIGLERSREEARQQAKLLQSIIGNNNSRHEVQNATRNSLNRQVYEKEMEQEQSRTLEKSYLNNSSMF
ncbi:hypothetical protein C9374_002060 [Naegleria lovaniensis]|uniref:CCDC81 HU domain-containing protein n=1 Tax=Naegleria lovaniensis TaxID=51637 RepID=A0AA88KKQ0_NAELO|nr:uncharacterized protein C9374_002060 [Naegleria lovaniensis]KAG2387025.1 hypothetical protein C9374_002060 [Naegleria lovaniensis]